MREAMAKADGFKLAVGNERGDLLVVDLRR